MPGKRVHGNVGAARQAAAGQAAVVWSKIQQTQERRTSDHGLSYTQQRKWMYFWIIYMQLQIPRMWGPSVYNKQGAPLCRDQQVRLIRVLTTLLHAHD